MSNPDAPVRIALPRALHHFYMGRRWRAFLESLGCAVEESAPTDRETLDRGVSGSISDLCLPVKAYMGHAGKLAAAGLPLFVPRLVSIDRSRYYCPKFLSLPDMVRARFPRADLRIVEINARKGPGFTAKSFAAFASSFGAGRVLADRAFEAMRAAEQSEKREALAAWETWAAGRGDAPRVAVVGHPYVTRDPYVSSGVVSWLAEHGACVATCEMVPDLILESADPGLFRDVYWEGAWSLFRGAVHFLGRNDLDGMVFLSAFGCGPDSFISDMIGRRVRRAGSLPFARLLVDEHTAREGLVTRLEAFMDMVQTYRTRKMRV